MSFVSRWAYEVLLLKQEKVTALIKGDKKVIHYDFNLFSKLSKYQNCCYTNFSKRFLFTVHPWKNPEENT